MVFTAKIVFFHYSRCMIFTAKITFFSLQPLYGFYSQDCILFITAVDKSVIPPKLLPFREISRGTLGNVVFIISCNSNSFSSVK
jgi:hypothetical protein